MNADLAARAAAVLRDGFADYHAQFAAVTQRARRRFEERDWASARADAVERIELYDRCATATSSQLTELLGEAAADRSLWNAIRDGYAGLIAELIDQELYKTFFNTISRRFHKIRGVAPDIEVEPWPSAVNAGRDPQLDRAIEEIMKQLPASPPTPPSPPPFPRRALGPGNG